ncbi:MAG: MAPEG family protein [Ketobacteraceae bacterium]|nr:MAPEG family protein [Ketobacteraceae bacterium]
MMYFYLYVAVGVLMLTLLAANVSRVRIQEQIAHGDGDSKRLKSAIRAHMNSLEQMLPFALVLLVLAYLGTGESIMMVLVFGFLITRMLFAYGFMNRKFRVRQVTAGLTYLFQLLGCVLILVKL